MDRATPAGSSAAARPLPPPWVVRVLAALRRGLVRLHRRTAPPPVAILEALGGVAVHKGLGVAAELGIADHLAAGPQTAEELARRADLDAEALERLLRALVALDLLHRQRDGRYRNNAVSERLRADHPESLRDVVVFFSSPWMSALWSRAAEVIRNGAEASRIGFFERVNARPELEGPFNAAMAAMAGLNAPILPARYDFSRFERVCDVGGGTGTNLAAILERNAGLRGVLFDLPNVVERARDTLVRHGVLERCQTVGGSFFEEVPGGCDGYVLQAVLHDWGDDECARILANLRRAIPQDGRLLVVESVVPESGHHDLSALLDLQVLVATGSGRERTAAEFRALFASAGFRLRRRLALPTLLDVMELVPG